MTDYNSEFLFPDDPTTQLANTSFQNHGEPSLTGSAFKENEAISTDEYDKLERLENKKQNRKLRKDFAYKAYNIASVCIGFWMFIVVLSILSSIITGTREAILSDTALGIITTGVTINVFAALLTVIKGLFTNIDE